MRHYHRIIPLWWHSRRWFSPPRRRRPVRVAGLLAVVFVLSFFDLALTHSQLERGNFLEVNVVAAGAIQHGLGGMTAYKAALLGFGAWIIYHYRRQRVAEVGAWVLAVCHVALMFWWQHYLALVEICSCDPFTSAPNVLF